jgi:hypothetical protein
MILLPCAWRGQHEPAFNVGVIKNEGAVGEADAFTKAEVNNEFILSS